MMTALGFLRAVSVAALTVAAMSASAMAQIAVSANDGKMRLDNGDVKINKDGIDTISFIDLAATPPKTVAEIKAPASVVGPPTSVAVGPKEDIALVTAAMKLDPSDPTKQVPNDVLTVIDLKANKPNLVANIAGRIKGQQVATTWAPEVVASVKVGLGAAGVSINKAGNLAIVANRSEGTVSVLSINGKTVTPVGDKIKLGDEKSGPSGVVFTPDGKFALVTRDNDHKISVLAIEGTKVTDTKREISAGLRPYGIDIAPQGDVAIVANIGTGSGDSDTVSVIDLAAKPQRVVSTVSVGQTPEGIKISPDGKYVALSVMNGTNKPSTSPFFNGNGKLVILRRQGRDLTKAGEIDIGKWCQGIAWSSRSNKVAVQCMVEEQVMTYSWNGRQLQLLNALKTTGGPAGIRTAEK